MKLELEYRRVRGHSVHSSSAAELTAAKTSWVEGLASRPADSQNLDKWDIIVVLSYDIWG